MMTFFLMYVSSINYSTCCNTITHPTTLFVPTVMNYPLIIINKRKLLRIYYFIHTLLKWFFKKIPTN